MNYIADINFTKVPVNLSIQRDFRDLQSNLRILDVAVKQYDSLFNYTKHYQNKIGRVVNNIEQLSKEGVPTNNERITSKQQNIERISQNYITTKEIMNSPDILVKKVTIDKFITTLGTLYQAFADVYKNVMKIPADKLFKANTFGSSSVEKQTKFGEDLLAIMMSIKSQRAKFSKLKSEIDAAEEAQRSGETVAKLETRLRRLRSDFNSASSVPIAGISAPAQRNRLGAILSKVQRTLNTTARGGKRSVYRKTRKHSRKHSRK